MATCRRGRTGRLALVLSLALGVVLVAAAPAGAASGSIIKWNVFRGPLDDGYQCIAPAPGGVYAAGFTDGSSRDVLIAKNSSANLNLGSRWWDNPAAGGTDVAIAEAVDRFGNVAVAGSADGPASGAVNTDFLVLKMSRSSEPMWTAVLDGGAMAADAASDVVCDRDGNVYATGWRTATVGASFDYWTVKLDASDGHVVWQQFYNSGVGRSYGANAICLDAAGNVYVTGGAGSADGGSDMVTVKYDNLGNQQWVVHTPGPVSGDDWGTHIALGRSGALFVAGTTPGAGGHDFLLAGIHRRPARRVQRHGARCGRHGVVRRLHGQSARRPRQGGSGLQVLLLRPERLGQRLGGPRPQGRHVHLPHPARRHGAVRGRQLRVSGEGDGRGDREVRAVAGGGRLRRVNRPTD